MKLLTHLLIFVLGAGAGIWWGVYHPAQAANVASQEEASTSSLRAEIAKAKLELLQKLQMGAATVPSTPSADAGFKRLLDSEKQKVQSGN